MRIAVRKRGAGSRELGAVSGTAVFYGMKSDPFPRGRRLSDELFNCGENSRKLFIIFLFQTLDLARQVAVTVHQTAELHKGAHDRNIYFDGTGAVRSTLESMATPCSVKA